MTNPLPKVGLMHLCMQIASRMSSEYKGCHLCRSAVVFSPHFDDETLGCGGTVIKKKQAGADVKMVFMTDGSKSHAHMITEEKLKEIRAGEGLAASRSLGLSADDVILLQLEESKLNENITAAINRVTEILASEQPEEIFIPYHREPPLWSRDHLTTNDIVVSALQTYDRDVVAYEYPIWFWYNWSWNGLTGGSRKEVLNGLKNGFVSFLSLLKDFRCSVYVEDVLDLKRAALSQYKSQMTRLVPDARWQILSEVSNGDFLECFFQEREIFHVWEHSV